MIAILFVTSLFLVFLLTRILSRIAAVVLAVQYAIANQPMEPVMLIGVLAITIIGLWGFPFTLIALVLHLSQGTPILYIVGAFFVDLVVNHLHLTFTIKNYGRAYTLKL